MGKLVKLEDLKNKKFPRPVVLTGGAFDLLHLGHVEFLKLCKSFGNTLIVAVASDERVSERKGNNRPIIKEEQRAKLLSYLEFVDFVFISHHRCEDEIVYDVVCPDILVLSDKDRKEKEHYLMKSLGEEKLKKLDPRFVPAKFVSDNKNNISTTNIINLIRRSGPHDSVSGS